jgi:hypothetical protein
MNLMTMRNIKAVCSKSNERKFVIQYVMNEYEESNATIQARHPKLFNDDTHKFEASKELMMCMPFDFIDGLKDNKWTHIDKKWLARLMKHLKNAQSSTSKHIRYIGTLEDLIFMIIQESMRLKMIATYMRSFFRMNHSLFEFRPDK